MLKKTIKQILIKKVNEWVATITDEKVQRAVQKDLIITGGCFTSMIMNEDVNDYDCYFRTKETVLLVANYYAKVWNDAHPIAHNKLGKRTEVFVLDGANPSTDILNYYNVSDISESRSRMIANTPLDRVKMIFPSDGIIGDLDAVNATEELGVAPKPIIEQIEEIDEVKADEVIEKEQRKYFPVFISSNAITLSDKIQLVVRFYGEPEEVHDTFDFIHTRAYWKNADKTVHISEEVYEMTINKTLRYVGSKYPVCSIFRLRKFINRGWKINAGQMLKICMQISALNLMDIDVLESQLVGVDSLYFMNLIEAFRIAQEKDAKFVLDAGYVMSLVDKIF